MFIMVHTILSIPLLSTVAMSRTVLELKIKRRTNITLKECETIIQVMKAKAKTLKNEQRKYKQLSAMQ